MASQLSSIINSILTTDVPPVGTGPATTSPAGSLTLPISVSNVISQISPTLSAIASGIIPVVPTILVSSTPTITTPSSTLILTSSSPNSIRTISTTSAFSSITPIPSTSAPLFESGSSSVSPTGTADISSTTDVTVVSGTTVTSVLPTTLTNSPSADVVSRRTAAIAGATTGFVVLFLIALGVVFWYRRHKLRKVQETTGKKREGRGLLDGEEFDDDERNLSTSMQSYHYPTHVFNPEGSTTSLNLMRSRTSETGSIFREEVWPPPGFIDPILKQNSEVDLSGLVNDVMGPSSYEPQPAGPSAGAEEPRQPTDESSLSASSSASTSSLITPPTPLSSSSSIYPTVALTSSKLLLPAPSSRSFLNSQPRKPSPLAHTSMSDPKLWLTRNVRQSALP